MENKKSEAERAIINGENSTFDEDAYRLFVQENGAEVCRGYIMALADMKKHLESMLKRSYHDGSYMPETPAVFKTKACVFHEHLEQFLSVIDSENFTAEPPPEPERP